MNFCRTGRLGSESLRNPTRTFVGVAIVLLGFACNTIAADSQTRLDNEAAFRTRTSSASTTTRAIVMLRAGAQLPAEFEPFATRALEIIHGYVLTVPAPVLARLAANPSVLSIHFDRPATKFDYRTSLTVGSLAVSQSAGFTGAGVGVAVIDSGVASWHDDLTSRTAAQYPFGNQRVSAFVDFVRRRLAVR